MSKVWFITGTSRGFGREWAVAALDRGDQVVATARDVSSLEDLTETYGDAVLVLPLDVTDREAVFDAVARATERFGRIDVLVNNAGYGQFGMFEEHTEQQIRAQFETNLFGALWVMQAVLPVMRGQGAGRILQTSSIGGVTAFPMLSSYHGSKWALEGMSQSIAQEVADFGVRITLIEPGPYSTDWSGSSARHTDRLPEYAAVDERLQREREGRVADPGEPAATRGPILELLDAEDPPLRMFLGAHARTPVVADYQERLATWDRWQTLAERAQG